MSTRCIIQIVEDGRVYTLYRHTDGYPSGVLADIKKMKDAGFSIGSGDYFLANMIFLAKYNALRKGLLWNCDYGVGGNDMGSEYGDLAYKYRIWYNRSANKKIEGWYIEIWERQYDALEREAWVSVFYGRLEDAFEKFVKGDFENGCHITEIPPLP